MRKLFIVFILSTVSLGFAKEKNLIIAQISPKTEDYSWIERYYLVESFNVYDFLINKKADFELTDKQISDITAEYEKIFPIILGKARIIKDKEEELRNVVIKTNDSQRVKELVVEIAKLKAEITAMDINLFKSIQSILSKKQNEKLTLYILKSKY